METAKLNGVERYLYLCFVRLPDSKDPADYRFLLPFCRGGLDSGGVSRDKSQTGKWTLNVDPAPTASLADLRF